MNQFFEAVTQSWYWQYFFGHFGWVDWVLTVFVLVGILLGLKHGLSAELPRLFETAASLYVTMEYYGFLAQWLARETPWPESYAQVFTFAVVGFASWFALRLLFEILGKFFSLQVAAPFQILGGALLGAVRYLIFFSLISYLLTLFPVDFLHRSYQVQSWSGHNLVEVPGKIHAWLKALGLPGRPLTPAG